MMLPKLLGPFGGLSSAHLKQWARALGSGPEVEIKTSSWKLGKYEALRPWKNSSKPFSQSQRVCADSNYLLEEILNRWCQLWINVGSGGLIKGFPSKNLNGPPPIKQRMG